MAAVLTMPGEWWFVDGVPWYADGDVGDADHMLWVMQHVGSEFLDDLRDCKDRRLAGLVDDVSFVAEDSDPSMFREAVCNWADQAQRRRQLTDAEANDPYALIRKLIGWDAEKLCILSDNAQDLDRSTTSDPRFWAMKYLGWVRVAGNYIELWKLTTKTLEAVLEGLAEAEPDLAPEAMFTLEVRSTGKVYHHVPYVVLQAGSVSALQAYLRIPHPGQPQKKRKRS